MNAYEDMTAAELRDALDEWRIRAIKLTREFLDATRAGNWAWASGIEIALRQALGQVRRLERLLELGIAA